MDSVTADETATEVGLDPALLNKEYPDTFEIRCAFAKLVPNWVSFANALNFSPQDKRGIEVDANLDYAMKTREVFSKWKGRLGSRAVYRLLIDASLKLENDDVAKKMCELIKHFHQPQSVNQQKSPGGMSSAENGSSRSGVTAKVNQKDVKQITERAYVEGVATGLQGQRLGGTKPKGDSRLLTQTNNGGATTGEDTDGAQLVYQTSGSRRSAGRATGGGSPTTYFAWDFWNLGSLPKEIDGQDSLIAILDTGVNISHIAFSEGNVFYARNFVPEFIDNKINPKSFNDVDPDCHGTSVASIAAGAHCAVGKCPGYEKYIHGKDIKVLPVGVAPNASLVICRVARVMSEFDTEAAKKALEWILHHNLAVDKPDCQQAIAHKKTCELDHDDSNPIVSDKRKIRIVSMSFKLEENDLDISNLVDELKKQGVVCIAGAGNDGQDKSSGYPAAYGNVLSVGYNDCVGNRGSFSTVDYRVDVLALGERVLAAFNDEDDPKPCFEEATGTSFAAPAVAGLVALLLQCARDHVTNGGYARKYITNVDVLRYIFSEMIKVGTKHLTSKKVIDFFQNHAKNLDEVVQVALGRPTDN